MAGALAALVALPLGAAAGFDSGAGYPALDLASQIAIAQNQQADSLAAIGALSAAAANPVAEAQRELAQATDQYLYRQGIRSEQRALYQLAVNPTLQAQTLALLTPAESRGVASALSGLRSIWAAAGITDLSSIQATFHHVWGVAAPVSSLLAWYQAAGRTYQLDWTYLAAINYIESDFGRVVGPSSAGAEGPMQFLPSTWTEYGQGGDILNPQDAILAAARFLSANGAPNNYAGAIYHYNLDDNYVASVTSFAAALRSDPDWLPRLYNWSTFG